jgi:transposase-like protein
MKKGPKMKKYRVHSAETKAAAVNEVRSGRSMSEVARENGVSPNLIRQWIDKAESDGGFEDRPTAREKELERQLMLTERKLAQAVVELDLLKKLNQEASRRMKRSSGLFVIGKPLVRKEEPQK